MPRDVALGIIKHVHNEIPSLVGDLLSDSHYMSSYFKHLKQSKKYNKFKCRIRESNDDKYLTEVGIHTIESKH